MRNLRSLLDRQIPSPLPVPPSHQIGFHRKRPSSTAGRHRGAVETPRVFGSVLLILASLVFSLYISNFGNYSATYGSIGAVIILMLWLYIAGFVILVGSEINALLEHHSPHGKRKGEKTQPES